MTQQMELFDDHIARKGEIKLPDALGAADQMPLLRAGNLLGQDAQWGNDADQRLQPTQRPRPQPLHRLPRRPELEEKRMIAMWIKIWGPIIIGWVGIVAAVVSFFVFGDTFWFIVWVGITFLCFAISGQTLKD
jgi:hypothetical protein